MVYCICRNNPKQVAERLSQTVFLEISAEDICRPVRRLDRRERMEAFGRFRGELNSPLERGLPPRRGLAKLASEPRRPRPAEARSSRISATAISVQSHGTPMPRLSDFLEPAATNAVQFRVCRV